MYDPTIGVWISEDPIGFEAADENLRRYVGNNPTLATDPSGEFKVDGGPQIIKNERTHARPTVKKRGEGGITKGGLIGNHFRFSFEQGDFKLMVQQVSLWGVFTIWDECGRSFSVAWEEGYLEAWAWGNVTKRSFTDTHMAGPAKPAEYLQNVAGFSYQSGGLGREQYLVFENGEKVSVVAWRFYMESTFTMANADSPIFLNNQHTKFLGTTDNPGFKITNVYTPEGATGGIEGRGFTSMLKPQGTDIPALKTLVPAGPVLVSQDVWDIKWSQGMAYADASHRSGYSRPQ